MSLRFNQLVSFSFIALLAMIGFSAPGAAGVVPQDIRADAEGYAFSRDAAQAAISNGASCGLHHLSTCHTRCKQPFTRELGQRVVPPVKKRIIAVQAAMVAGLAYPGRMMLRRSGRPPRLAFLEPAGSPYKGHRARTGRQLN